LFEVGGGGKDRAEAGTTKRVTLRRTAAHARLDLEPLFYHIFENCAEQVLGEGEGPGNEGKLVEGRATPKIKE